MLMRWHGEESDPHAADDRGRTGRGGTHYIVLPCDRHQGPGNGARTRSRLIVRGLIEREGLRLIVTELGRAVLSALLASE